LSQVLLSIVNAKIVGRFRPRRLIGFGLALSSVAVAALTVGVLALHTPLLLTCAGFLVLMASQAFIFGNASALAAGQAPGVAGAASAVLGVVQAIALAISAPLASSGGARTAVPMIWVMLVGVTGAGLAYLVLARPASRRIPLERPQPAPEPVRNYLVVANRTLGGPELLDSIRDRMSRGPATFWVLAPATPTAYLINEFNALSCAFPIDPELLPRAADLVAGEEDFTEAGLNLDTERRRLRALGASVDGSVGDPDPMKAIEDVLAERSFDEIILSTLPAANSMWLAWDLPHRIRRRTEIPLTVIAAQQEAGQRTLR
jgi:DHA1 family bicyclomycin/chloramphenicol resistance-like MFS transporter